MEPNDGIVNAAGDVLYPVKSNKEFALFQVIAMDGSKDIFFIAPLEPQTDFWGTKLHLKTKDGDFESQGHYILGKKSALEQFEKISPENEEKNKHDQYYTNRFKI